MNQVRESSEEATRLHLSHSNTIGLDPIRDKRTVISVADTTIGNSHPSSSVSAGDNTGSASATVTITMFTVTDG